MNTVHQALLAALFGGFVQEIVHWYSLRAKLNLKSYQKLLRSTSYWIITALMIVASAIGPVLWKLDGLESYTLGDFMILGAAFPLIFKKAVSGLEAAQSSRQLGGEYEDSSVGNYFR